MLRLPPGPTSRPTSPASETQEQLQQGMDGLPWEIQGTTLPETNGNRPWK